MLFFQPGKMHIRVAGGKQESWFPLFVERGSLGSFGASPGICHQSHKRWEMLGCPRQQEGGSVMEVQVCSCCWTCGNGENCPQKEVSHVAAQRYILGLVTAKSTFSQLQVAGTGVQQCLAVLQHRFCFMSP